MLYLILLSISLITPVASFFFCEQMAYRFHFRKLAHSDKWFWDRKLSDEELDEIAVKNSKKFAKHASWVVSIICISIFIYLAYLNFTEDL